MKGADVFLGLSVKGALTPDMVASMAAQPIIFAMANPDPGDHAGRGADRPPDAIVATGRSDYPNQVNNVLGFPYIFRGALDVRARRVNQEMKIACAQRPGRSGARGRARRGRRRLSRPALKFGPALHHPRRRSIRA